ncbi:MAG: hypothetical protein K2M13_03555 [Muribaculaceae bacterium]|nr:hypothetical protein [Muribaculaceae bacterium]
MITSEANFRTFYHSLSLSSHSLPTFSPQLLSPPPLPSKYNTQIKTLNSIKNEKR